MFVPVSFLPSTIRFERTQHNTTNRTEQNRTRQNDVPNTDPIAFEYRADAVTSDGAKVKSTPQHSCWPSRIPALQIVALGPVRSGRTGTTNQSQKHPEMRIHDTIAATNDMPWHGYGTAFFSHSPHVRKEEWVFRNHTPSQPAPKIILSFLPASIPLLHSNHNGYTTCIIFIDCCGGAACRKLSMLWYSLEGTIRMSSSPRHESRGRRRSTSFWSTHIFFQMITLVPWPWSSWSWSSTTTMRIGVR